MLNAKTASVTGLTKGIEGLFKKNKVDYIKGTASFSSPSRFSFHARRKGNNDDSD